MAILPVIFNFKIMVKKSELLSWRVTPHFSFGEFFRTSYQLDTPLFEAATSDQCMNVIFMASQILEPARASMNCMWFITSGFRSKELNSIVHGASQSRHLSGRAVDLSLNSDVDFRAHLAAILEYSADYLEYSYYNASNRYGHFQFNF